VISDIVRALVAAGASPEMILGAVEAAERAQTSKEQERLLKQRERTRRWRGHTQDVTSRDVTGDIGDVTSHHVIHHPPPKDKNQTPTSSSLRSDDRPVPKTTPRIELEAILGPEHSAAVIDHRQRLGSPLTAHAAKLLAAEFAKCADPDAAADTMIARGWRGFKPKWLEERHNGSPGPPKPPTGSAKLVELLKKPFEETYGRSNGKEPPGATVLPIRNR
jgi:hypothetical protein